MLRFNRQEAVAHFQRFLQTHQEGEEVSVSKLQSLLTYRCPTAKISGLVAPVSGE